MPFGDRTGPRGLGPRTGRGLGYCSGYSYPGYMNPLGYGWGRGFGRGWGRGFGRGFGRGWGRGWGYSPYFPSYDPYYSPDFLTPKEEKEMLNEDLEVLRKEMKAIEERLKELEMPKESQPSTGQIKKTKK